MFHHLTPPFILDQFQAGRTCGEFEAATLFVDISGFTQLTVALMQHGAEGAEVLAQVLAKLFTPLIDTVEAHGGFIAHFAGDAFKAVFPATSSGVMAAAELAAVAAAWEIRRLLQQERQRQTRFGPFAFAGKACVGRGLVSWQIWQETETRAGALDQAATYLFAGPGLQDALALDPYADQDEVVISSEVAARLSTQVAALTVAEHSARVDAFHSSADAALNILPPDALEAAVAAAIAHHFYPSPLLHSDLQGEFRRVTTVFVTLTRTPTEVELSQLQRLLFATLNRFAGFLCRVSSLSGRDRGPTLLLLWGAPAGTENDVERALSFLLELRAACPVPLRGGVTTGLAYAGFVGAPRREEYTAYGARVNLAARLATAAQPDEFWLDDPTARQAIGFRTTSLGARSFKGFAQPQPAWLLAGRVQERRDPFYRGRLLGRDAELARLSEAIAPLARGRCAGVVTLVGEAGIGKSRLAHEFLAHTPDVQVFLGQCDEILRQPFNPLRHWLHGYFNQTTGGDEDRNKKSFQAKLDGLIDHLSAVETPVATHLADELMRLIPFLGALVDLHWPDSIYQQLEPQLRYENTLEALKTLIKAESIRRPVVLHLEDVHWLDSESAGFLHKLLRNVTHFPFLILATSRPPEVAGDDFDLTRALDENGLLQQITLTALERDGLAGLGQELLGATLDQRLADELARRADGNPFFAEQILLYLRDQALIEGDETGWRLREHADLTANTVLSGDVRTVLTARLDRLAPQIKETVQTAAVLGREFDTAVLRQMSTVSDDLAQRLEQGSLAAIWSPLNAKRYLFRHGLLRDAAYDMQLRSQLRRLHHRAADAIQTVFAHELAPRYADLAYHFGRAEAYREERRYAGLAGTYAAEQFANDDALRYLARALELTDHADTDYRFRLLLEMEAVHETLGAREAQRATLAQVDQLLTGAASPAERARLALRQANLARVTTEYEAALRAAEDALTSANQAGQVDLEIEARNIAGRVLWRMQQPDQAAKQLGIALTKARAQGNEEAVARNLYDVGLVEYHRGAYDAALKQFRDAQDAFASLTDLKGQALCQGMIGTVQTRLGDYAAAIENLSAGHELVASIGWVPGQTHFLANWADALLAVGLLDEASARHEQAYRRTIEIGDREGEAYSLDGLGLVAYFQENYDEAIRCFQAATQIYGEIGQQRLQFYTQNHLAYAGYHAGDLTLAAESLQAAQALLAAGAGDAASAIDTLGAAAAIDWATGDHVTALAHCDEIAAYLDKQGLEGIEYPIQVCWVCYEVNLRASAQQPARRQQARTFLQHAAAHFYGRAATLSADLQHAYRHNIPLHRRLADELGTIGQQ